jgi:N-sulfoglucosamine sulfohydrolase
MNPEQRTFPTRRAVLGGLVGTAPGLLLSGIARAGSRPPNVLLITADDMNWDSPGVYGGQVRGITPNIDRLAREGMRFTRAHVTAAVCQPSRSALMTGRYPHRNGAEGFQPIREDVPTLQESLREGGYLNGIMAKNSHLAPRAKFCWDFYVTPDELGMGRDPSLYYRRSREFFARAKAARQPFFLMANSQDPHRPFAGSAEEIKTYGRAMPVRRTIQASEAAVPGFLPDLPGVRKELGEYFTSVYRCDETVGEVLRSLAEEGLEENTLVMFLSDNGMSFPFSKTNCYLNSTKAPWIVRWPGRIKAGSAASDGYVSGIDFMPTILDAARLPQVSGMDGRSFLPMLEGHRARGRDRVFTVFHETSAKKRFEMRCVQNARFGYIWNAWSDGRTQFRNEAQGGLAYQAMVAAAASDPRVAERVKFFLYRAPEEFYDLAADPSALKNLIAVPSHVREIDRMRSDLREWMARTGDPLSGAYRNPPG